jgi:hypothetical protein
LAQSPIPNPQSPIPNPQNFRNNVFPTFDLLKIYFIYIIIIKKIIHFLFCYDF